MKNNQNSLLNSLYQKMGGDSLYQEMLKIDQDKTDWRSIGDNSRYEAYKGLLKRKDNENDFERIISHFASAGDESKKLAKELLNDLFSDPGEKSTKIAARSLMLAAKFGDKELYKKAFSAYAGVSENDYNKNEQDENTKNKIETALQNISKETNQYGENILHYACQSDNAELVMEVAAIMETHGGQKDPFRTVNNGHVLGCKIRPIHYMSRALAAGLDRAAGNDGNKKNSFTANVAFYRKTQKTLARTRYQALENKLTNNPNKTQIALFGGKANGGGLLATNGNSWNAAYGQVGSSIVLTGVVAVSAVALASITHGAMPYMKRKYYERTIDRAVKLNYKPQEPSKKEDVDPIDVVPKEFSKKALKQALSAKDPELALKIVNDKEYKDVPLSNKTVDKLISIKYFQSKDTRKELFTEFAKKSSATNIEKLAHHLMGSAKAGGGEEDKEIFKNMLKKVIEEIVPENKNPENTKKLEKCALVAAMYGDVDVLKEVNEKFKDYDTEIDMLSIQDKQGNNLLHYAIASENVDAILKVEKMLNPYFVVKEKEGVESIYDIKNKQKISAKRLLIGNLELANKLDAATYNLTNYTDYANDKIRAGGDERKKERIGYKALAYMAGGAAVGIVGVVAMGAITVGVPAAAAVGLVTGGPMGAYGAGALTDMAISKGAEMALSYLMKNSYEYFMDKSMNYDKAIVDTKKSIENEEKALSKLKGFIKLKEEESEITKESITTKVNTDTALNEKQKKYLSNFIDMAIEEDKVLNSEKLTKLCDSMIEVNSATLKEFNETKKNLKSIDDLSLSNYEILPPQPVDMMVRNARSIASKTMRFSRKISTTASKAMGFSSEILTHENQSLTTSQRTDSATLAKLDRIMLNAALEDIKVDRTAVDQNDGGLLPFGKTKQYRPESYTTDTNLKTALEKHYGSEHVDGFLETHKDAYQKLKASIDRKRIFGVDKGFNDKFKASCSMALSIVASASVVFHPVELAVAAGVSKVAGTGAAATTAIAGVNIAGAASNLGVIAAGAVASVVTGAGSSPSYELINTRSSFQTSYYMGQVIEGQNPDAILYQGPSIDSDFDTIRGSGANTKVSNMFSSNLIGVAAQKTSLVDSFLNSADKYKKTSPISAPPKSSDPNVPPEKPEIVVIPPTEPAAPNVHPEKPETEAPSSSKKDEEPEHNTPSVVENIFSKLFYRKKTPSKQDDKQQESPPSNSISNTIYKDKEHDLEQIDLKQIYSYFNSRTEPPEQNDENYNKHLVAAQNFFKEHPRNAKSVEPETNGNTHEYTLDKGVKFSITDDKDGKKTISRGDIEKLMKEKVNVTITLGQGNDAEILHFKDGELYIVSKHQSESKISNLEEIYKAKTTNIRSKTLEETLKNADSRKSNHNAAKKLSRDNSTHR